MRQTLPALVPREQTIWSGILLTLEGYRAWDNFDHAGAVKHLSSGLRDLEVCCSFSQDHHLTGYTHSVRANFADLNEMSRQTNFFKKLHLALVHDLTSNARRRAAQNKYDDAIARLYRALEMMGQVAFEECTGCTTSNVPLEKIPRRLQKEYSHKYGSGDNKQLKLPLFATFRVLAEMNEPVGLNFIEHKKDFDGLIFTRNNSILAHGVAAVEKNTYEKFEALIKELLGRNSFIEFPRLDW
jgi:CRISPR-associated protein (TIGR02710 family)